MAKGGTRIAGRQKGTQNKRTKDLADRAAKLNVDPFEILLHFAGGHWEELGYQSSTKIMSAGNGITFTVDVIEVSDRIQAAKEACNYIHAKRKSVEVTGEDGKDLFSSFTDMAKRVLGDQTHE